MRFVMLASLVVFAGCNSSEESTTVAGTTYTSDQKAGTASIKSSEGEMRVTDGAAADKAELPAYAPRYPGATITGVIESKTDGGTSTMANLQTKDAPAAVAKFYRDAFTKNGMKLTTDLPSEQGAMLSAEGNGNTVSAMVSQQDGMSVVTLTYSKAK
jgi:hypothetical protein